jgi:hypothetical protein
MLESSAAAGAVAGEAPALVLGVGEFVGDGFTADGDVADVRTELVSFGGNGAELGDVVTAIVI